ncbi:MAG TPA: FAD:protein FMN transferase [Fulvivirga sp.]|nr:FAD:protein FMN transferase [Fulvivirga sp.]
MSLRLRNILYTIGLFSLVFLVWKYREGQNSKLIWISGKTMGPITYNVKYFDTEQRNFKPQIDSLLQAFNQSLSTYIPNSEISQFNQTDSFTFKSPYFLPALKAAKEVYQMTDGAFDPSIGPLIDVWGFGPGQQSQHDSTFIDSLKNIVGYDKIVFDEQTVTKKDHRVTISFSASAKGYGVDVVAKYLESKGIENLFVEIGGEVRVKGINKANGKQWAIGILDPDSDEIAQFQYAVVTLNDRSMATSGNYFNYHIVDGIKYGHTIDPKSGFPIRHNLLSASVFAENCETADALATAFMVMGTQKTINFLKVHPQYDAYLIYNNEDGKMNDYATKGVIDLIKKSE